ncbi:hypothetical protein JT358_12945 [Micrococcales bacterium 31B]|nr:hypothetical protein [Micrococcales bacterium 31B]
MGDVAGTGMARESVNLTVDTGAVVEVRVLNGVQNVYMDLITQRWNGYQGTSTDAGVAVPADGTWVQVTAKAASAVLMKRAMKAQWPVDPQIEVREVSGTRYPTPADHIGDDRAAFLAE